MFYVFSTGYVKSILTNPLKKFLTSCWILGMRVDPPTNIISSTLDLFMSSSFKTFSMTLSIDWNNFYWIQHDIKMQWLLKRNTFKQNAKICLKLYIHKISEQTMLISSNLALVSVYTKSSKFTRFSTSISASLLYDNIRLAFSTSRRSFCMEWICLLKSQWM